MGFLRPMMHKYEKTIYYYRKWPKRLPKLFKATFSNIDCEGTSASFDKKTIKKIQQIKDLPESDKLTYLFVIDVFLMDANTRKAYSY